MKRIFSYILFVSTFIVAACGTSVHKDGKIVCENLMYMPDVDSLVVVNMLEKVDSLITPEVLGRDFGIALVKIIEGDSLPDRNKMNQRLSLFRRIYTDREGQRNSQRFSKGLQSIIDAMPVERQMRLYVKISTPAQMGTAFRIDRYRLQADTVMIKKRIEVLRHIYDKEEMTQFNKYYNR